MYILYIEIHFFSQEPKISETKISRDKKNLHGQVSQFSKLEPRDLGFRESSASYVDWHHFGVQKVKGDEVRDHQSRG